MQTAHEYYQQSKKNRPKQIWKKMTKAGKASRLNAAAKGEMYAVPVRMNA